MNFENRLVALADVKEMEEHCEKYPCGCCPISFRCPSFKKIFGCYGKKERGSKKDHAINNGELCPECLCMSARHLGFAPDGQNANHKYQCRLCDHIWEGY